MDNHTILDVVDGDMKKKMMLFKTVWRDMNNHNGRRENFHVVLDLKVLQNKWQKLWTSGIDFQEEFIGRIVEERSSFARLFLRGRKLSSKSPAMVWKPVTGRNLCCTGPFHAYGHYSEAYPEIIFHHRKGNLHPRIWR